MGVTALYKTFDGEEWIAASLESIYDHVDHILLVHSDMDWCGRRAANKVISAIDRWRQHHDTSKLTELQVSTPEQMEQYQIGLNWLREHRPNDAVLLIDSDEVWDETELLNLLGSLQAHPEGNVFRSTMRTYIRSPFFQLDPIEPIFPVSLIRDSQTFAGVRGMHTPGLSVKVPCHFHHFTAVREDEASIIEKVRRTGAGEKIRCAHPQQWYRLKFLRLPHVTNFHYAVGYEANWKSVRIIDLNELPLAVRQLALVQRYLAKRPPVGTPVLPAHQRQQPRRNLPRYRF